MSLLSPDYLALLSSDYGCHMYVMLLRQYNSITDHVPKRCHFCNICHLLQQCTCSATSYTTSGEPKEVEHMASRHEWVGQVGRFHCWIPYHS